MGEAGTAAESSRGLFPGGVGCAGEAVRGSGELVGERGVKAGLGCVGVWLRGSGVQQKRWRAEDQEEVEMGEAASV